MRLGVIGAATMFFLSVFASTWSLLNGRDTIDCAVWLTASLFWLRFESCLALRVQNDRSQGDKQ